ncbi:hypothetical protein [Methylobacter tundripaludum]|uniref:hypothetical protein n=1 Tax=Methylobacter tundripaludum TaxID=173365 RepID=UPI0011B0318F|nr:hypothetical protein [Methylobacter tundripaludum]
MKRPKTKISATRRVRNSHSASKPTTPLNRLRGAIGERKNWGVIRNAMDSVKNDGASFDFERLIKLCKMNPLTAIAFAATKAVKKTNHIQSVTPLDTIGIYQEIAWVTTVLASNSDLINEFVRLRNEYIDALSNGNYEKAEDCLVKIDKNCGFSLWTFENRIALETLSGGFERQKSYVNNILSREGRTFVSFFASSIGERNESRVSKFSFETRLREKAKTWNIKLDQQKYIFFKLIGVDSLTLLEASDILSFEAASSPIDLYETFLEVMIIIRESLDVSNKRVLSLLPKLKIEDHCLNNLWLLYSDDLPNSIESVAYLNAFLGGQYQNAVGLVEKQLAQQPTDPLAILTAARLTAMGHPVSAGHSRFIEQILSLLCSFLSHDKGSDEATQSLERFALNFRSLAISSSINNLILEASSDLLGDITAETSVRSKYNSLPVCLARMSDAKRNQLLNNQDFKDASWQYERISHIGESNEIGELSSEAIDYAYISYFRRCNKPSKAFSHLEQLANSRNTYLQEESSILRAWFLYIDGDIEGAILHTVRLAISNPMLLRSLPLTKLFEHRGFRDLKQLERDPCLSIGLFLYIHVTRENSKDVALKVAWKQFHKAHGLVKPSELKTRFSEFNSAEILFFLRNVCTQEIMELSSAFNSPADLDRERLQICIALSELDTDDTSSYDDEIIELTRRLSIEDGVQQVESSRVYVDLLGLQRWCHQNLNELFLRYLDYAGSELQASAEDFERSLISIFKKSGLDVELVNFLDSYDISADSLLGELIKECARHFLTLPRFGLDAFLGSRVRHGSLEGAFRNPLEKRKLITKIDSSTNQYESNAYWLNSIESTNADQYASLNKVLNAFSRNIDTLLDSAISRYVHVRSVDNPDGLITLWPSDKSARQQLLKRWLISTKSNLSKEVTIEQLVEYCATNFFWPTLKSSLNEAADFVTITLAGKIHTELCALAVEVQKITPNHHGLVACITAAKSDIENAATKVSKWFAPPQFTNLDSSYLLKTGIEIGITSLRHLRPQFDTYVEWDVDERANVLLHPTAFQTINDVAFLILGNIFKHSGFFDDLGVVEDRPRINIWLRWNDPDIVEVEVRNAISNTKDIASIEANVNSAKEQIRLGQFDTVARQKNKTGLVRLASALNYENSGDKIVDFGVVDGSSFRVMFAVPIFFLTGLPK